MNDYCEFDKNINFKNTCIVRKITNKNVSITRININSKQLELSLNKTKGFYTTIFCQNYDYLTNNMFDKMTSILIREIKFCLNLLEFKSLKNKKVFIVGLGNSDIPADALGNFVCKKIISTHALINKNIVSTKNFANVFSLSPSVETQNGIETPIIIKAISKELKPDLVILIDSMTCHNYKYLGKTIQLSNAGFTPGSEMSKNTTIINKKFLGCPVLTIGCPFVIDLKNLVKTNEDLNFLSSKDITLQTESFANIISFSINKSLHKKLTKQEIIFLSK